MKLFSLVKYTMVLLVVICLRTFADDQLYYQVDVQNKTIGYIQWQLPMPATYNHRQGKWRKVFTMLKSSNNGTKFNQQIFEKTFYQSDPYKVMIYTLVYHKNNRWEQQQYYIGENTIDSHIIRGGQSIYHKTLPISSRLHIVTDYFSIVALLQQREHPTSLLAIDPKQILPRHNALPSQQLIIRPQGTQRIVLHNQQYLAKTFLIKWNKTVMKFWLRHDTGSLLQITDKRSKSKIFLIDKIPEIFSLVDKSSPLVKRPVPFDFNKTYRYLFLFKNRNIGSIKFRIKEIKNGQEIYYRVSAKGSITNNRLKHEFVSKTIYNKSWKPVSYKLREKDSLKIACDFTVQGIKVSLYRNQNQIDRFVPLSGEFMFVDNNAIQHFAIFAFQCPLRKDKKFHLRIFHPRRMQVTEGVMHLYPQNGIYKLHLQTPYYQMHMDITPQGKLVRYSQGNLQVILQ